MTDDVCELVITAPDPDWLIAFARTLVEDHLAAAAHHTPIRTVYRWEGQIYDHTEGRVAVHTRTSLIDTIIERTRRQHPYEVPGIFTVPITGGSDDYIAWILQETADGSGDHPDG